MGPPSPNVCLNVGRGRRLRSYTNTHKHHLLALAAASTAETDAQVARLYVRRGRGRRPALGGAEGGGSRGCLPPCLAHGALRRLRLLRRRGAALAFATAIGCRAVGHRACVGVGYYGRRPSSQSGCRLQQRKGLREDVGVAPVQSSSDPKSLRAPAERATGPLASRADALKGDSKGHARRPVAAASWLVWCVVLWGLGTGIDRLMI